MGHFKNQLPTPNTHQFTSQHPPPGAHTPLVCPTSSPRPGLPRSTRPPATCLHGWASPPPGARGPASPRARAGRAEPRRRAGLGGELHLQTKGGRPPAAGRRPRGWVGAATGTGPRLGMRRAPGHSAHSNSFSPSGLASTATCQ